MSVLQRIYDFVIDTVYPPNEDVLTLRGCISLLDVGMFEPGEVQLIAGNTVVALGFYREPQLRAALHQAKFASDVRAHDMLGEMLMEYLTVLRSQGDMREVVLVPLPLSKARLRERGFNQVEVVAHAAQKRCGAWVHVERGILSRAERAPQSLQHSTVARAENIAGAYTLTPHAQTRRAAYSSDAHYILLDDVATTGHTFRAATRALKPLRLHYTMLALAH